MTAVYYLLLFILYPISALPPKVRRLLSGWLCFFLGTVIRYRREVMASNIHHAYPDMTEKEKEELIRRCYRHLADIIMEVIRQLSLHRGNIRRHIYLTNPELLQTYHDRGRSLVVVGGHLGNWEWASIALGCYNPGKTFAIYKPVHNRAVDRFFKYLRERMGLKVVKMKDTLRNELAHRHEPHLTIFIADQTPLKSESQFWMPFMRQEAPIHLGAEKIAKKMNYPVLFLDIKNPKRGFYEMTLRIVTEQPQEESEFAITEKHTRMLEACIDANPDQWLWSHRRWKHRRDAVSQPAMTPTKNG